MSFVLFGPLLALAAPLTIDGAVDRALSRAPELAALRHGEDAAAERVEQAAAMDWPRLSLEAGYLARWPKNELPIDFSGLPTIPGFTPPTIGDVDDIHHFQAGLQLGVILFDATRGPKVEALEQMINAERAKTAEAAAQLAFQTRSTFLAALFARDVAAIAEESLSIAREEEQRARRRFEVGTGTEVTLAQARVRRAGLEAQRNRARNDQERYLAQLASLIGAADAPGSSIGASSRSSVAGSSVAGSSVAGSSVAGSSVAGSMAAGSSVGIEVTGDLEVLSSTAALSPEALARSPVLLRLAAMRAASLSSARAKSRAIVPTVSALGKAEVVYPRNLVLEVGPVLSAGVNLSWTIFDGFLRSAGVAEAEAQASQLEESERATRESLGRKLIELEARRKTATADVGSARESLAQAQVYVRAARAAVESGAGTELELTTAKNGMDQARIAVSSALLAAALVEAERLLVYGVVK